MRVLALETSGRMGSVALMEREGDRWTVVREAALPAAQRTARSLLPAVKRLLDELAWKPGDVNLVCATTGPGSFTGLRIGVVAAKTFAYATGAKLVGVHTLAAMAEGAARAAGPRLWAIVDAQREELFVAEFDAQRPMAEQAQPRTEILSWPDWMARLSPGDCIAGLPLKAPRQAIPAGVTIADESLWTPSAAAVGRLGAALFDRGEAASPLQLVPSYFRKSAAEEKAAAADE